MSKPEDLLPLTPTEFQVLIALAAGDRHGYALMQEVKAQTNGQINLGPGTLYTLLDRLLTGALIEESPRRPEQNEDQRRRYYRLTRLGRRVLEAEAQRLESLIRAARRRLSQHA
ncbi:MAG: helix-turn-helix transcriptional regulator [Acidobacteria bacterium]|nr:helix-turn-helix transcriptional regulator [Acidobacteriota bacterium]